MLLLSRVCSQFAMVITFLMSAQFLTVEMFGAFALASAITMLLSQLCHVGFHEYTLRELKTPDTAGSVWVFNLGFGAALSILVAVLAFPLSLIFSSPDIAKLMLWWSITPLATGFHAVLSALAFNKNRFVVTAAVWMSIELLGLVVVLIALTNGLALDALLIHRLIITLIPVAVLWAVLRYPISFDWNVEELRTIFHFVKHFVGSHFVGFGSNYGADLALGFVAGAAATGMYRFGARIVIAITAVSYLPLTTLAWTDFSKIKGDSQAVADRVNHFLPGITLMAGAPLVGLAAIADPMVTRLAPPEWQGAVIVVQILALIAAVALPLNVTIGPSLGVSGQERWIPITQMVNATVSIAAILLLARYGVAAAALAQGVAACVMVPFLVYLLRKYAGMIIGKWLQCLGIGAMAAAAMWLGVQTGAAVLAPLPTVLYLPSLMLVGAGIYITIVAVLAPTYSRWFGNQLLEAAPESVRRRLLPILGPRIGLDIE